MIKAVLFDLDGTLLPLDHHLFLQEYTREIAAHVRHLVDPMHFISQLLASTAVMVSNNDPKKTNERIFATDFYPRIGIEEETLAPILEAFYCNKFPMLSRVAQPSPDARRSVQAALDLGLQVVVATNPIFPLLAIKERLLWAGVNDMPFVHVTCYEESHFCKPNPAFYQEVAVAIGRDPEECLMVGNDMEEDLVASDIGMKTYLVTDCLIDAKRTSRKPDYRGKLAEFPVWLPGLIEGNI